MNKLPINTRTTAFLILLLVHIVFVLLGCQAHIPDGENSAARIGLCDGCPPTSGPHERRQPRSEQVDCWPLRQGATAQMAPSLHVGLSGLEAAAATCPLLLTGGWGLHSTFATPDSEFPSLKLLVKVGGEHSK